MSDLSLDPAGTVVAVLGGSGGAGASTLAAALAVTARRAGATVALVDADPLGGGLDLLLGAEQEPGLRWPDLGSLHGPVAARALTDALPSAGGVTLLSHTRPAAGRGCGATGSAGARGPGVDTADIGAVDLTVLGVPPAAMTSVLDALARRHDLVVVDLGRWIDVATQVVLRRAQRALLVVPAQVRAVAAAAQVARVVAPLTADLQAVVRGPSPTGLRARPLARLLGLPLAGTLRSEDRLSAASDRGGLPAGSGRGALAELSRHLWADLRSATVLGAAS